MLPPLPCTVTRVFLIALLTGRLTAADGPAAPPALGLETQRFDRDPDWDGHRNRLLPENTRTVVQRFGWNHSAHAGGRPGEIGGRVQRSLTRARYSFELPKSKTLDDSLQASGRLAVSDCDGSAGALIGWFHESSDGWRTPSSVAMRVDGNGSTYWMFAEYGTRNRKTGGIGAFAGERYQTTETRPFPADGAVHHWEMDYDPDARDGLGELRFRIDDRSYLLPVSAAAREDGALFNRFGIWNQQATGGGLTLWLDDLTIDGRRITFDQDPDWIGEGNVAEIEERIVRPFHQFGYSDTSHAGGQPGEVGGIIWRDEQPSYYAAPVEQLTLDDHLEASGTLTMHGAGADSAVYIGWFDSQSKQSADLPEHEQRQRNYLGALLEGPSRAGHYFRPGYGASDSTGTNAAQGPIVLPDRSVHRWTIRYEPSAGEGTGVIRTTLDGRETVLPVNSEHRAAGAVFDRFGLFNMQSGGWHVEFYIDDLRYTSRTVRTQQQ